MATIVAIIGAPAIYPFKLVNAFPLWTNQITKSYLEYFIQPSIFIWVKCLDFALKNLQSYIERKVVAKHNLIDSLQPHEVNPRQAEFLKNVILDNKRAYTIN